MHGFHVLLTVFLLLNSVAFAQAPIWGLRGGESRSAVLQSFTAEGNMAAAQWTSQVEGPLEILRYDCAAKDRCFSHPSRGEFYLIGGQLASASFFFSRERGPSAISVRGATTAVMGAAGFREADARRSAVGRQTQYFLRSDRTVVWVIDGLDTEIKLYVDRLSPIGRAEAVSAGARASLDVVPGVAAYARAHREILAGGFDSARLALEAVLQAKNVALLLKREARYVLAMVLSSQVKQWLDGSQLTASQKEKARIYLDRAQSLAPSLQKHLMSLRAQLTARASSP